MNHRPVGGDRGGDQRKRSLVEVAIPVRVGLLTKDNRKVAAADFAGVITSYSIHYTKLYDPANGTYHHGNVVSDLFALCAESDP